MQDDNFISIILPVYNGEKFLSQAIESCLAQTYKKFELIIVNDCSSDTTREIAEKYKLKDNRVTVIHNPVNKLLPASLNIGHRAASGEFFTWTSDDNILKPHFLKHLLHAIKKQDADIVYSNYDIVNRQGDLKRVHIAGPTEYLFFGNKIGASFLYKRKVYKELKGFDESLFLLEDYDFWLRAWTHFKFYHLDDNLYQYRIHANSLTADIRRNNDTMNRHKEGILKLFEKQSIDFNWNKNTFNFLTKNILNEPIFIIDFLKERRAIEKDLLKVISKYLKKDVIMWGFETTLRNQLITHNCNFKTLVWVLKYERWILLHPSFSKKTTLNYSLHCLFP
ncbi:MAG: hypothetical protein CL526_00890 [Aequorivita sp.]|nr:hypothetical protein [Aequorivita sp.]|tara:strand:+ start:12392 stop:13399 length:1008 start_codon:yes stop_codon:yes gene_type:complete